MRKLLLVVACLLVTVMYSLCLAEIPQGYWMKKVTYPGETWGESQYLQLNFDNPEQLDGIMFYGSIELPVASEMDIIKFSKPEISGNTAKCKAYYYYVDLFSEDGIVPEPVFNDRMEDCTITYDPTTNNVSVKIGSEDNYLFRPSDIRNRIVSYTDNLNVRKTPVSGQKIGTITMFQTLPMLSVAPQNKGADWYEVRLPDGNTGFVSGQYVSWVSPGWLSIPYGMIKPNVSYVHAFDNPNPQLARQTSLEFVCKGNQVMCYSSTSYPLSSRMAIEEFLMGRIEENIFIFDRSIPAFGDVDAYEIFEKGNFSEFSKHATELDEPEIFYFDSNYANGRFFDANGSEYNAHEF